MIADRDTGIEVQSTVQGERVQMGVRAEDLPHLMGVLTDLYGNKKRAVIREYATNALDAHIEAKQTRPIEVTMPGRLAPFLTIRDYGTGLSVEDIHSIYSQYGRSTKRSTNDAVGMLGLGCKSALTYCSMFTVTSVKDGTKIQVQISRDSDGSGAMTVVDTVRTTEPNGTTVTVPVAGQDVYAFENEAKDFFKVWKPGTVLVDGKEPTRFEGLRLSDDLYIVESGTSQVVMGNVAYPAPQLDRVLPNGRLLAFVPIGAVNFPPSREALMDTATTRATIASITEAAKQHVLGAIQREVDKQPTPADAVKLVVKWQRYVPSGTQQSYTFKGKTLPTSFFIERQGVKTDGTPHTYRMDLTVSDNRGYNRLGYSHKVSSVEIGDWPETVWVLGFTPEKFTAQHKKKLRKWCEQTGLVPAEKVHRPGDVVRQFVCAPIQAIPAEAAAFIDPARVADWEVVRKIALEPKVKINGVARIPGSYDLYTENGWERGVEGSKIRQDCPIFYHHGNRWSASTEADQVALHYPKFTLVCLPANRIEKFKRDVPSTKTGQQAIIDKFESWLKGLTADQKLAMHISDRGIKTDLSSLEAGRIKDPALREGIRLAKIDVSKELKKRDSFRRYANTARLGVSFKNPLEVYPLFDRDVLRRQPDHVYNYLNCAYGA
jgi:hypothetical protein